MLRIRRPTRRSPWRRSTRLGAIVTLGVLLTACNPVFGDDAGPVRRYILTRFSDTSYLYVGDQSNLTVLNAAPFPDGNVREFFWNTNDPFLADQQTCMTWNTTAIDGGGPTQPGIGLRIAPSGPEGKGLRGISIDENIWSAAYWSIFVLLWESDGSDSRDGTDYTFTSAAQFDISPIVGKMFTGEDGALISTLVEAPWHVCARTLGLALSFKIWTGDNPEPPWDDPTHVFSATLPQGWDYAGYSGGYIGHLKENRTATFSDFSTTASCGEPDLITTPYCQDQLAQVGITTTTLPTEEPTTSVG